MKLMIFNQIDESYQKLDRKVKYYLARHKRIEQEIPPDNWLKIWIGKGSNSSKFSCGILLPVSRHSDIYIRKLGTNVDEAIEHALKAVNREIERIFEY